jgi:FAD synthase
MNYWTPSLIAKHLETHDRKVSTSYIRRLCRAGRIKAQRLGHEWVIEESEAQRWIAIWMRPKSST